MEQILESKLEAIARVFPLEDVRVMDTEPDNIKRYYRFNKIPYSVFHTRSNFVHMGISRDGVYKETDFTGQAEFVEKYITEHNASTVLELAAGRGANSLYLAERHPDRQFYGIDISEDQLSCARKPAKRYTNVQLALGDYHDLSRFADNSMDVVFVVEALCYGAPADQVLQEVQRVLTPGGYFIVYDGYRGTKTISREEQIGMEITERSMAVAAFLQYAVFTEKAANVGFSIAHEEDLTLCIMPTLRRLERLAERFFRYPRLARMVARVLPSEFTYNAVAGMLLPSLCEQRAFEYRLTVMQK